MSLDKNLGGRLGVKGKFQGGGRGGRGQNFYFWFVNITRGPKNFRKNAIFWPKRYKFSSKMQFFPRNWPLPPSHPPPKLMYEPAIDVVSIVEGQKRISVIVDRTLSKAAEVVGQVAKADREIVAASVNLFYSLHYSISIRHSYCFFQII